MGASDAVCLDFDFAIRAWKRWTDRRGDEQIRVQDHSPEPNSKQRMKSVPKYPTLWAVLGLTDTGETPDTMTADPDVDQMVAKMLTGAHVWQPQEWPLEG